MNTSDWKTREYEAKSGDFLARKEEVSPAGSRNLKGPCRKKLMRGQDGGVGNILKKAVSIFSKTAHK